MISIFFARLLGIVILLKGLSLVFKRKECVRVMNSLSEYKPMLYFVAVIELIIGLTIVLLHNNWNGGWQMIITVLGWFMVLAGAYLVLSPIDKTINFIKKCTSERMLSFWSIITIIIGTTLIYFGFKI